MASRRRRFSMERLKIFDLDNLPTVSAVKSSLPPPLPPPRKLRHSLLVNPIVEHSKTLYDHSRCQRDPVYAAAPMFTVVPQERPETHTRRILGARIPPEIVRSIAPIPPTPSSMSSSSTPKSPETPEPDNGDDEKQEDDDDRSTTNDNDNDADKNQSNSSSSSSSDGRDDGDDILHDDDDNKKGVVEQIINRNKVK